MTRYKPADVVLVHFPFTDSASLKKRPAIVINSERFSQKSHNYILLALTSKDQDDVVLMINDWTNAGLVKPTWIKPIIFTVSDNLIENKLGHLTDKDIQITSALLRTLLSELFL